MRLSREEILYWLQLEEEAALKDLWSRADETRKRFVGDEVHLRGLIEFSNHCRRNCTYCGIRAANTDIDRYRMPQEEIIESAELAREFGYGTVVIQGGEDASAAPEWIADTISKIKNRTGLAVTLSLSEQTVDVLKLWKQAGADRYLMRFETSDAELYSQIHPPHGSASVSRMELLRKIKKLGYEAGSGVMVGLPGQTFESLARDLELFVELELDMVGIGPYLPHPNTPLGREYRTGRNRRVPNTAEMALRVLALTRLLLPDINLPSTTAITTLGGTAARVSGLSRGANVIMPNITPRKYSAHYEIYPSKAGSGSDPKESDRAIKALLRSLGRPMGKGPGMRKKP